MIRVRRLHRFRRGGMKKSLRFTIVLAPIAIAIAIDHDYDWWAFEFDGGAEQLRDARRISQLARKSQEARIVNRQAGGK